MFERSSSNGRRRSSHTEGRYKESDDEEEHRRGQVPDSEFSEAATRAGLNPFELTAFEQEVALLPSFLHLAPLLTSLLAFQELLK